MPASTAPRSDLTGWTRSPFTGGGLTYDCFEKGTGPGVVLIPEIPGITPEVLGLAEHLVDSGFTVVVPSPFGEPDRSATPASTLGVVARLCVSAEFRAFAVNAHRPVTDFLRAVAADLAARTLGKGVGVIGMCFTGGFALAAAIDDTVRASVLSQPAVPFPLGRARKLAPGPVSTAEFDRIAARAAAGEVCALGLRFSEDGSVPRARFETLKRRLGDAFEVIELDSSPGNSGGFGPHAHSVLTNEVREVPGHPALAARDRTVQFLRDRLTPAGTGEQTQPA
ncbi:dienelactone hydrolase family protein [Curtobacterium sp. MCBD17_035]|uniref:dienelactone hydrolase family protein n=1 Tax=Curtobacterium sp. MCBD17_035 TaxID=2175673 RepID=UPI000DAACEE9|nr:dienelactone hydrolase family protein [Curtobacterium sp. MCBD17_035]WIB68239.1 dienelactone hydrolase family protein [Curtobacterium sp. MCBD17_035]